SCRCSRRAGDIYFRNFSHERRSELRLSVARVTAIVLALFLLPSAALAVSCAHAEATARLRADMEIPGTIVERGAPSAIIFVHGLAGDARSTWTNANGTYWPALVAADPEFQAF